MIHSMTGFGSASGQVDGVEYAVEIRSVNNRYFKISMKLPDSFSEAESEIEKLLRIRLERGSVTLSVRMKVADDQAAYRVNEAVVRRYLEQLRILETDGDPTLRIDLGTLLQLPGCCEPPPLAELVQRTKAGLMALISQALDALVEMRAREGEALRDDLLKNCDMLEENLRLAAERAPQVVADYQQRLAGRVKELVDEVKVRIDDEHLAREVAIFAERCDIAEEIARLTGHLDQFRSAVERDGAVGRKLDFIAQEMLREANTIGSKANDAEIARACVEIKTGIDRIKEQVQNAQ